MKIHSALPVLFLGFTMTLSAQQTTVLIHLADQKLCTVAKETAGTDRTCPYPLGVAYGGKDHSETACWKERCDWVVQIPGALHASTPFSLRLGRNGRTPCRRSTGTAWNRYVEFNRRGDDEGVELTITRVEGVFNPLPETAGPPNERQSAPRDLAYARVARVRAEEGDVPCAQGSVVPGTLDGVQFKTEEDLRLQVFPRRKVQCAVIIDAILLEQLKKRNEFPLDPAALARAVQSQSIQAKLCYPPDFTSVESVEESLRQMERTFYVEVK